MDIKQMFKKSKISPGNDNKDESCKRSVESLIQFYESNPLFYNRLFEKENSSKKKSFKSNLTKSNKTNQQKLIAKSNPEITAKSTLSPNKKSKCEQHLKLQSNPELYNQKAQKEVEPPDKGTYLKR